MRNKDPRRLPRSRDVYRAAYSLLGIMLESTPLFTAVVYKLHGCLGTATPDPQLSNGRDLPGLALLHLGGGDKKGGVDLQVSL